MPNIKNIKLIALASIILTNSACASEGCIFNEDAFSQEMYSKNNAIAAYTWSQENKEAKGVLQNGNIFSVKHWSCNHYGTHAVMLIGPYPSQIPETLNNDFLLLAEIALEENEINTLKKMLTEKPLKLSSTPAKLNISTEQYSEFYISYSIVNEVIILEIKLYNG